MLDLAGTKAAVITQRAESKDYIDILAITGKGISLAKAMAAAQSIYGEQYNPMLTVKSLTSFADGDLPKLTAAQRMQCQKLAESVNLNQKLPFVPRIADSIN